MSSSWLEDPRRLPSVLPPPDVEPEAALWPVKRNFCKHDLYRLGAIKKVDYVFLRKGKTHLHKHMSALIGSNRSSGKCSMSP